MARDRNFDLFDGLDRHHQTASDVDAKPLQTLAVPCGFRDRRNLPCRRLGRRPVTIAGECFHHRGYAIVHCDPECYRGEAARTDMSRRQQLAEGEGREGR